MRNRRAGRLPAEVTSFVGRRAEIVEVKRLLGASRLVTLTGVGGVGKTRLAVQTARTLRRVFEDGVWLVDLAKLSSPALLVNAVTGTLEIRDQSDRGGLAVLREHLAGKRLLLVLDNCEHMLTECAVLVDELLSALPELRVLTTSRQELGAPGEYVLEVPPLSLPDGNGSTPSVAELTRFEAVMLFAERAGHRGDFTLDETNRGPVVEICRHVEGIPLAIELATVRLRTLSPQQILKRLKRKPGLLARGPRTVAPRHQTMRGLIDWSFEQCTPPERLAWARSAVFAGGFDIDAAETVVAGGDIRAEDVMDLIDGLVDKSVLTVEARDPVVRYRMLETLREHARGCPYTQGEARRELRRRYCDYYQHLAAEAVADMTGRRDVDALARLRAEHANFREALHHCSRSDDSSWREVGLRLAADLRYHWATNALHEGRIWLDRLLTPDDKPSVARANALWVNAWLALTQGDLPTADTLLAEARTAAEQAGARSALSYVEQFAGQLAMSTGDHAAALNPFHRALIGHQKGGDLNGVITTLNRITMAHTALGYGDDAAVAGEQALNLCQTQGSHSHHSYTLWVLGLHRWRQGDIQVATAQQRQSIRLRQRTGDIHGQTLNIEALAWIAATDHDYQRAAILLGISAALRHSTGARLSGWGEHLAGYHDDTEHSAREALGDTDFRSAYEEGAALTLPEATAFALDEHPSIPAARTAHDGPAVADAVGLTGRERQVADLVASGHSNKDIGGALVISTRTVEAHVNHILTKLGFTNRAQIASWAAR